MNINAVKTWLSRIIPIAIVIIALLLASACSSSNTTSQPANTAPNDSTVSLNGGGATFPNPLYTKWFDEYYKITGIRINYQAIGSGGGIQQITAGTLDFGASDGIMTPEQQAAAESARGPIQHIPMTSGAVAVVYNVQGLSSGLLKLSGDVLANIFLKKITKWNDPAIAGLNPGLNLPGSDIAVVHRSDGSGTTAIFTYYLSQVSEEWKNSVGSATSVKWPGDIGGQGNAGVAGQVQQIPGAIGYVEVAYAKQNNLAYALLRNSSGNFIEPSIEATTRAAEGITLPDDMKIMIANSANPQAYPIAGFTWILAYVNQNDQQKGKALAEMLWWAIHDAQRFATPLDYAPLSSEAVEKAEQQIKKMNFQGQPYINP